MADITQFPRGLVSLTGLRDMGEAPRDLSGTIAPTIDITQFLLLNRELVVENWLAGIPGNLTGPTVPPGELWYVHSFSVNSRVLVGVEELRISPMFNFQGRNITMGMHSANALSNGIATAYMERPSWIGAGTALGLTVERIATGGVIDVFAQAVISRLRV